MLPDSAPQVVVKLSDGWDLNHEIRRATGRIDTKIEGHEVIDGEVKPTGNGAHVLVPKDWRGADVKIVRTSEPDG